ncbi:MAG TPA: tetratricopeptide repeat protein [Polyangiaceae bacterium]|nr:tetratricopeptide repeat protein [Polyangiaceae bacterium]
MGQNISRVVLGSFVLLACHHDKQNPPPPSVTASATHSASASASAAASASTASSAQRTLEGPPITPEQLKRYQAALGAGRVATQHHDSVGAERAFGEALAAIPDDARAHSERGYARLLQGDLKGAAADLDKAFGASDDPKLTAQIWFNRGLVAERNGDEDNARAYYATSLHFNPTQAARRKLDGKTLCPASLTRLDGHDYPNWLAVWNDLSRKNLAEAEWNKEPQPGDEQAVRKAYGLETCSGLCVGYAEADFKFHAFVPLENGAVRVFREVYNQSGGRCEGTANVEAHGDVIDITTAGWTVNFGCPMARCMTSCGGPGEWRSVSLVLEPKDRKRLLSVSRYGEGEKPDPRVLSTLEGVRVDLPSCTVVYSFGD